MKKIVSLFVLIILSLNAMAQNYESLNKVDRKLTKFEQLESQTGRIVKFQDINMPWLNGSALTGGSCKTKIRLSMGEQDSFFYILQKQESSNSRGAIAAIEYSDLVEINRALETLVASYDEDVAAKPEYLENKFRTVDGFEVGYYVSSLTPKGSWYVKLDSYSGSIIYPKQADIIRQFAEAQSKIEALKATRN